MAPVPIYTSPACRTDLILAVMHKPFQEKDAEWGPLLTLVLFAVSAAFMLVVIVGSLWPRIQSLIPSITP